MFMVSQTLALLLGVYTTSTYAAGFRTIGSSGVAPQLAGLTPYTDRIVFVDKYHENHGYPSVNLTTGADNPQIWYYPGTQEYVFGSEFDWRTAQLRRVKPSDDTSCSIGAYFPDGTLVNIAGGPPLKIGQPPGIGFERIRTYAPGPCKDHACTQNWVERGYLSTKRWYLSAQTLTSGDVLAVGGSKASRLIYNQADINVPSYEIIPQTTVNSSQNFPMPILEFTTAQNKDPNYVYNLYPILHLLPNDGINDEIFTVSGNRAVVWDYSKHKQVKAIPDTPKSARTFPSSATTLLLPLIAPKYTPEILLCGGCSNDAPNPITMNDCYRIKPYDDDAQWEPTDNLPNGGQVMSNGILLPDQTILMLNGAHKGSAGGRMADNPVTNAIIYDPNADAGSMFTTVKQGTTIARMYHSVAMLLPSGEVLVAGSNTAVNYSPTGAVNLKTYPHFRTRGHEAFLDKQQGINSTFPTEYRVEIFSPPYMSRPRPAITEAPDIITHNTDFVISATSASGLPLIGTNAAVILSHSGFSTHSMNQGQRMAVLHAEHAFNAGNITVTAPRDGSVMPPGVYLLWIVVDGAPSPGKWIKLAP